MIEQLLKYQEVDAGLRKIEVELAGSEARKKAVVAKKYLEGVDENVMKLDVKAAELAHIYETLREEIKKLDEQREEFNGALETAEDENALNYLAKKIDEVLAKVKNLAQETNRVADAMQSVYKDYAVIYKSTKAMKEQLTENGAKYNELLASKQEERSAIEEELKKLAKDVDPKLMERYLAKRKAKVFPIVYAANGDFCGACNYGLSGGEIYRLKTGEVIECEKCGKLLYLKK